MAAEALRLAPDDATIWNNYGVALSDAGSWDEAEQAYDRALELDPEHALALGNLGVRHVVRGRLEEGRQAYDRPSHSGRTWRACTRGSAQPSCN